MSLPHTQTTREFCWCAYTEKVRKFGGMLRSHGHQVVLYAGTENEADVDEFVSIIGQADLNVWFGGPWDETRVFDRWSADDECWHTMNRRAITEIAQRIEPNDAVGIIGGLCQADIVRAFPNHLRLEWGIGYSGVVPETWRAYETHAWRHYVAGRLNEEHGRFFDTVIPNSFEPFTSDVTPGDYLLYLGRPTVHKGLPIVAEVAKMYDVVTAGQADPGIEHANYAGLVRGQDKADLLAGARAVLVPTTYIEPFGGVAVEAMLAGTPVITTDFGAFTETVDHGVTGFRCCTLQDFIDAIEGCDTLDREAIRKYAADRYTVDAVAPLYDRWLRRLETLFGEGWYQLDVA